MMYVYMGITFIIASIISTFIIHFLEALYLYYSYNRKIKQHNQAMSDLADIIERANANREEDDDDSDEFGKYH